MTKQMTISNTAEWLREHDDYLIITHRRPDGDTLGSAAALCRALRSIGKAAFLLPNPDTTPRYAPFVSDLLAHEDYSPAAVIAVDIATPDLFQTNFADASGKAAGFSDGKTASVSMAPVVEATAVDTFGKAAGFSNGETAEVQNRACVGLAIDHHPSNTGYAKHTLVDPARAACGELVYDVIRELTTLDADMASALYIALATDTGCFSYDNTTSDTLLIAAHLAQLGAPMNELNNTLFRSKSRGRLAVEGLVYTNLTYHFDNRATLVVITAAMERETGATEDDYENIAAIPVAIEGVDIGITVRELDSGEFKVSVRSGDAVSSNEVCARFGGGGHARAAGFTSEKPLDEVIGGILRLLAEVFA